MRITANGVVRKRREPKPTALQRGVFFVVGAVVGSLFGYGYLTSGPGPAPSFFSMAAAPWILAPAAVVAILLALFPWALRRPGRFGWPYADDD